MDSRIHPKVWCERADELVFKFFGKHFDELVNENFPTHLLPQVPLTLEEEAIARAGRRDTSVSLAATKEYRELAMERPISDATLYRLLAVTRKEITMRIVAGKAPSGLAIHDLADLQERLGDYDAARTSHYLALIYYAAEHRRSESYREAGPQIAFSDLETFSSFAHVARLERRLENLDTACLALSLLGACRPESTVHSQDSHVPAKTYLAQLANPHWVDQNWDYILEHLNLCFM